MDGRAGVPPTETNGSVDTDVLEGAPAPEHNGRGLRFPLTIREVVRRGRADREELDRLRAEVDQLRLRAESAELRLEAGADDDGAFAPYGNVDGGFDGGSANGGSSSGAAHNGTAPNGTAHNGTAHNGAPAPNGPARYRREAKAAAPTGWATAAVLPRSKQS